MNERSNGSSSVYVLSCSFLRTSYVRGLVYVVDLYGLNRSTLALVVLVEPLSQQDEDEHILARYYIAIIRNTSGGVDRWIQANSEVTRGSMFLGT